MYKKSGFTLLEVLIVIMIMSILFVTFRGVFQIKNKDIAYGQSCIETIYGQVNNFLHAGLSSKSIATGTTAVFPDQYIIAFKPDQQLIELGYEDQGVKYISTNIEITGNTITSYCNTNGYLLLLSGDAYELHINKGLQENSALQFFYFSGDTSSISTGGDIFLQCDLQGIGCKAIGRFESDTRTISFKKQLCVNLSGSDCLEWDN